MQLSKKKKKLLVSALLSAALSAPLAASAAEAGTMPGAIEDNGETAYVVSELIITGNNRHPESEIRRLVPEATRGAVRTGRLSRQLSLLNDGQVFRIESAFVPTSEEGIYDLHLVVEESPNDNHGSIGLSNTGDKYTGKWRLALGWYNTDIGRNGDTLGFSYTTSPDSHFKDVSQVALTYKAIVPNAGDSMYVQYSYSDTDMGQIGTFDSGANPNASIFATGKGHTFGYHYQRNMYYTRARHQLFDFGLDYKKYENGQNYEGWHGVDTDYDVLTFSATYHDIIRRERDMFAWNIGWTTNLGGNSEDYKKVRANSDRAFNIFRLGANYQYTTKSDWLFGVNAYGQWTPNDLLSGEQFGAGGMGSVRGFRERAVTGDNGFGGSLEIYTPQYLPDSRFVVFVDAAWLSNNHTLAGERGHRSVSSFGIGYRYGNDKLGLYASLDYAKPLSYGGLEGVAIHRASRPWTFTLTKTF